METIPTDDSSRKKTFLYQRERKGEDEKCNIIYSLQDIRNKSKFLKNLDFDTKFLSVIAKPKTPHNTGQYITHVFNNSKQKDLGFINEEDIDDVCCYGTMIDNDNVDMLDMNLEIEPFSNQRKRYLSCDVNDMESHKLFLSNQSELELGGDLQLKKFSTSIFGDNPNGV